MYKLVLNTQKYIPKQRGHHYNGASTTNALKPYPTLFHCKSFQIFPYADLLGLVAR